jgi:hypothetical protein
VDRRPATAVSFTARALGATTLHRVVRARTSLPVGEARFWVGSAGERRFSPNAIGGATGRTLLVGDDPARAVERAVAAGARETAA